MSNYWCRKLAPNCNSCLFYIIFTDVVDRLRLIRIPALPGELKSLDSRLVVENEPQMEAQEVEDSKEDYGIQDKGYSQDNCANDRSFSRLKHMQKSGQGTDERDNADQRGQDGIGQHEDEGLAIVKTDAGVDPGAGQEQEYQ